MKGIILAAGEGKRLRPYTSDRPKCMVEYKGKPILDYAIEAMREQHIDHIMAVVGWCGDSVARPGLKIYRNPDYASTNMVHTLFCAEKELHGEDVVISYGDIVYRSQVLKKLCEAKSPISVVVDKRWEELWRNRMEDPLLDAETMKIRSDGTISELGKKPRTMGDIEGQYIGLIKFRSSALEEVRSFYNSLDRGGAFDGQPFDKMYMTTFLQLLIDAGKPVTAVFIEGGWIEVDSPADLECSIFE